MLISCSAEFKKILEKQGMKFKMGAKVTSAVKQSNGTVTLSVEPAKGGAAEKVEADCVLVSVGRRPYVDKLGVKELGVKLDNRGRVQIDDHFRTNIPSIWAIGDVIAGPMLAHKAEEEGIAVAEIIAGKAGHVNYNAIPVCTLVTGKDCALSNLRRAVGGIHRARGCVGGHD